MTAGNISVQLKTLEEAVYLTTRKYSGAKPRTDASITEAGRTALVDYLEELETILAAVRGTDMPKGES